MAVLNPILLRCNQERSARRLAIRRGESREDAGTVPSGGCMYASMTLCHSSAVRDAAFSTMIGTRSGSRMGGVSWRMAAISFAGLAA